MPQNIGGLLSLLNSTLPFITNQKPNVEVDALSRIPQDQSIGAEVDKTIFKAAVEGPYALMKIYSCH